MVNRIPHARITVWSCELGSLLPPPTLPKFRVKSSIFSHITTPSREPVRKNILLWTLHNCQRTMRKRTPATLRFHQVFGWLIRLFSKSTTVIKRTTCDVQKQQVCVYRPTSPAFYFKQRTLCGLRLQRLPSIFNEGNIQRTASLSWICYYETETRRDPFPPSLLLPP